MLNPPKASENAVEKTKAKNEVSIGLIDGLLCLKNDTVGFNNSNMLEDTRRIVKNHLLSFCKDRKRDFGPLTRGFILT